jgi:hypothetical protein
MPSEWLKDVRSINVEASVAEAVAKKLKRTDEAVRMVHALDYAVLTDCLK